MSKCLCAAVLILASYKSVGAAETIVLPAAGFDITCGGQQQRFKASGLEAGVDYYIYFEYQTAVGVFSQIGSGFEAADSFGEIDVMISVGTLTSTTDYNGRVRILRYMGAENPGVEKDSNSGIFRGNGP